MHVQHLTLYYCIFVGQVHPGNKITMTFIGAHICSPLALPICCVVVMFTQLLGVSGCYRSERIPCPNSSFLPPSHHHPACVMQVVAWNIRSPLNMLCDSDTLRLRGPTTLRSCASEPVSILRILVLPSNQRHCLKNFAVFTSTEGAAHSG